MVVDAPGMVLALSVALESGEIGLVTETTNCATWR